MKIKRQIVVTREEVQFALAKLRMLGKKSSIHSIMMLIGGGRETIRRLMDEIEIDELAKAEIAKRERWFDDWSNEQDAITKNVLQGLGDGYETALKTISEQDAEIELLRYDRYDILSSYCKLKKQFTNFNITLENLGIHI